MASVRLIRSRIKSAKNIAQITKAMELVAASKMKKAQAQALAGKLYAQKIYEMVMRVTGDMKEAIHPLLKNPQVPTGKRLIIIISSNKGLCGSLNSSLLRFALHSIQNFSHCDFISVGKKGARFIAGLGGKVIADFSEKTPFVLHAPAINDLVTHEYLAKKYDSVEIIYSEFYSALRQMPRSKTILPLRIEGTPNLKKESNAREYVIEPDPQEVLAALLPHYLENQIRDAILQAEASEHSARMVAMRSATDNAKSLVFDLSLLYNKARQEKITYEISDMITARLAVE